MSQSPLEDLLAQHLAANGLDPESPIDVVVVDEGIRLDFERFLPVSEESEESRRGGYR